MNMLYKLSATAATKAAKIGTNIAANMATKVANSGVFLGLLFGLSACQQPEQTAIKSPPMEVAVVTLKEQDLPLTSELPGRTVAVRQSELRPQVSGIIQKRLFEEGSVVEAGQQLYQIDPAVYQAALHTAQAQLARSNASLHSAKTQYRRYQKLIKDKAVSQMDFDDAEAAFLQAEADVAVSKAAVESAEINLAYTKVLAPISGRIGKSSVTEGALVTAGQALALTTIHQLDPIYVDLAQPANKLLNLRRQAMQGELQRNELAKVRIVLEDNSIYSEVGTLQFSEMNVNQSTGSVAVRAVVPNPDKLLLPGLYVRAVLDEGTRAKSILVPQRGITRDRQGEASALVVNSENTVEARKVSLSRAVGNRWLVSKGLRAGDRVIVEGLQKTSPGAQVKAFEFDLTNVASEPRGETNLVVGSH